MAIVSVLSSLAILSIIAASLLSTGTLSYRVARYATEAFRQDQLFEAAIGRSVLGLLDTRPDKRWRADGSESHFDFEGTRISVRLQDALGMIDLNRADPAVLLGLFALLGQTRENAARLAEGISGWRDSHAPSQFDGTIGKDATSTRYRPRHGPFQSLDELKLVADMTPELFAKAEPALTLYSGRQFVDQQVAPRIVLAALPGMDAFKADALVSGRGQPAVSSIPAASADATGTYWVSALKGRAFEIRAAFTQNGHTASYRADIRLTGNPQRPFWLLNWVRL